jgi:sterol desaturase/sphingolipid hydroxylase (fatty acid hydroxylase superfamily)
MPSILDILRDPATLAVLALFAALAVWERITPGRALPKVRGWNARALLAFVLFLAISIYLPLLLADWIAPLQLFDLSQWPTVAAAALGVVVYEFGAYAYHRSLHTFTPLWRGLHQMHHSAERLDALGAFWFSPLDMVGWTLLASLAVIVAGISPGAGTQAILITTFLAMFQHANVRTPRWLGYFVQRPESHTVHHARDVHRYNFADLPLFDLLFGTFRNPAGYEHATGFWHGASARVLDMLRFRDETRGPEGDRS